MRLSVVLMVAACLIVGCGTKRTRPPAGPSAGLGASVGSQSTMPGRNPVVTRGHAVAGRVASVNTAGRFVVLTFPLGAMPAMDKRLNVYRSGLKVGEVKVTGPQLDINIDADILAGECQIGDEVKEE